MILGMFIMLELNICQGNIIMDLSKKDLLFVLFLLKLLIEFVSVLKLVVELFLTDTFDGLLDRLAVLVEVEQNHKTEQMVFD